MLSTSGSDFSEAVPTLGIDEKLIAITMFYKRDQEVKLSDLFF